MQNKTKKREKSLLTSLLLIYINKWFINKHPLYESRTEKG